MGVWGVMQISAEVGRQRPGLLRVPGRWEAGRVGAGSRARLEKCHRAGALVCSLAAENGDKDKVGATWVPPNPSPGVPLRSWPRKGKAGIWASGPLLGLSKSQPPVLLGLLLLPAPTLTLFHVHAVSLCLISLGPHRCTRSSKNLAEEVCPSPACEGPGDTMGTQGPFT